MLERSPVYQSQVGEQLISLQELGINTGLIAATQNIDNFNHIIGNKLRQSGVQICLILNAGFKANIFTFRKELISLRKNNNVKLAYVRGIWGATVVRSLIGRLKLPYVYDVRGSVVDETVARGGSTLKTNIYSGIEKMLIKSAYSVTAVSTYLANNVELRCNINTVRTIPCCVNVSKLKISPIVSNKKRVELGYKPSDIIFVYSGGLSKYQEIPAMLNLWRRFIKNPDVIFLLLLNEMPSNEYMKKNCEEFHERLKCYKLPKEQVPIVLSTADIGFMLRESRELNKSASPVKFPEYLCAGLSIVTSPNIGDISNYINKHKLGVLIDPNETDIGELRVSWLIDNIRHSRSSSRNRAVNFAYKKYDWSNYKEVYTKIYR